MSRLSIALLIVVFSVSFFSCSKDKYEFLEGTWEYVNVGDIEDAYTYEWNFDNGELTMYRRLKTSNNKVVTDKGTFVLDTNPMKTTLTLIDTSQELINKKWDVITLDEKYLVIKVDIVGGVLYREFVKISDSL
jgi:hypothetical protein